MQQLLSEGLLDLAATLLALLASAVVTGVGVLVERAGLESVLAGQMALGAWELYMGTAALVIGIYLIGVEQALTRLRAFAAR